MDPTKSNYTLVSAVTTAVVAAGAAFLYVYVAQDKLPTVPAVPTPTPSVTAQIVTLPSVIPSVIPSVSPLPTPTSSSGVLINVNITLPLPSGIPTPVVGLGPVRIGL